MNKLFFLTLFLVLNVRADSKALTQDFKTYITQSKLGTIQDQAYCYMNGTEVEGYQTDKLQRIASITKLFTTFLAAEVLDLNYRFTTKIYISKDRLHIEGSDDPYFEEDKFLLLLQALNNLGYKSFKQVSFSPSFIFYDLALGSYEKITPEKVRLRISHFLNPQNKTDINKKWQAVRKFAEEEGVSLDKLAPALSASTVSVSSVNPLKDEAPVVYLHRSKPLHALLKAMNVMSKNHVAENTYSLASKYKTLTSLMNERGIHNSTYKIHNGSGLPIVSSSTRLDNTATCRTVLRVIEEIATSLKKQNLVMSDVIAINGGKDLGSFRDRFEDYPETHEAVLSKTGTLKHTSSLGGVLLLSNTVPFAVLNHTVNTPAARKFQDRFVARMFHHLGPAIPLDYIKISTFPWDNSEFIQLSK